MKLRSTLLALAAAAASLVIGGAPALGQTGAFSVSYADLNLASPAGRATLDRRIGSVARMVCGEAPAPLDLRAEGLVRACRAELAASARQQVTAIAGGARYASNRTGASQAAF